MYMERSDVLRRTWLADLAPTNESEPLHYAFFADFAHPGDRVRSVRVRNVEHGHCVKTFEILAAAYAEVFAGNYKWVVLVDDDTLLR